MSDQPEFAVGDSVRVDGDGPDDMPWTITEIVAGNPRHDGLYANLRNAAGDRSWAGLRILTPAPTVVEQVDQILNRYGVAR